MNSTFNDRRNDSFKESNTAFDEIKKTLLTTFKYIPYMRGPERGSQATVSEEEVIEITDKYTNTHLKHYVHRLTFNFKQKGSIDIDLEPNWMHTLSKNGYLLTIASKLVNRYYPEDNYSYLSNRYNVFVNVIKNAILIEKLEQKEQAYGGVDDITGMDIKITNASIFLPILQSNGGEYWICKPAVRFFNNLRKGIGLPGIDKQLYDSVFPRVQELTRVQELKAKYLPHNNNVHNNNGHNNNGHNNNGGKELSKNIFKF